MACNLGKMFVGGMISCLLHPSGKIAGVAFLYFAVHVGQKETAGACLICW